MFDYEKCEHITENIWLTRTPNYRPFVIERFELNQKTQKHLRTLKPNFGYDGFGEFIFYSRYSRLKSDGTNENWCDCVIRVVNGIFSIRKDWYIKHNIRWDEDYWQSYAERIAQSIFDMKWLPPGRGLWAMGTDYVFNKGSMSLYNCSFTNLFDFENGTHWGMDCLMNGVGVGFKAVKTGKISSYYNKVKEIKIIIGDSREEWCDATKYLMQSFTNEGHPPVILNYDRIRPAGLPIKGFGGISSGPEPLKKLHDAIRLFFKRFRNETDYSETLLKADIFNSVGCCVVAGNVRRSAELCVGEIDDIDFMNLKNYEDPKYAYRAAHGWMSNNSPALKEENHFARLPEIAESVKVRGEPGVINLINMAKGRIGKEDIVREDEAEGINPCGEIPLEPYEVCNVNDLCPTVCNSEEEFLKSADEASFYVSTVTLLPTHRPETNAVVNRNRRVGVGLIDFTGWVHRDGLTKVTSLLRKGYKIICDTNKRLAREAGVVESIRKTTIKPGGTNPKLPGKTAGCGYPTFHTQIRRVRMQANNTICEFLKSHNIPWEVDFYSDNTIVFEFPIRQGPAKPAAEASVWEQAMNVVLLQREWSDNAVSNTLYYRPKWRLIHKSDYKTYDTFENGIETTLKEYDFWDQDRDSYDDGVNEWINKENKIIAKFGVMISSVLVYEFDPRHEEDVLEAVLASITPLIKSISLLPHTPFGAYKQMPEEGIIEEEYEKRKQSMQIIDWTKFKGSDGQDEKFCTGTSCEV